MRDEMESDSTETRVLNAGSLASVARAQKGIFHAGIHNWIRCGSCQTMSPLKRVLRSAPFPRPRGLGARKAARWNLLLAPSSPPALMRMLPLAVEVSRVGRNDRAGACPRNPRAASPVSRPEGHSRRSRLRWVPPPVPGDRMRSLWRRSLGSAPRLVYVHIRLRR